MKNMYESLKGLIHPDMAQIAASTLNEDKSKVSGAIPVIIASMLGVMAKKGNSLQIKNLLHEASNLDILSKLEDICRETPTQEQQRIGDEFLQELLGDKAADFTNPIAEKTGISKVAANRLISMLSPVVLGYLGRKMKDYNLTMPELIAAIKDQKENFSDDIPAGVVKAFALNTFLNESTTVNTQKEPEKPKKRDSKAFLWILLLLLLILLFLWWRSCKKEEVTTEKEHIETVVKPSEPVAATNEMHELILPDGTKLQAYKGGIEDKMISFLKSDEYKKATTEELKNKWFEFDNIKFEFDSTDKLMSESETQLNNIAAILKYFKDAKIMIGGFADKKGSEEVNMEISKQRANTIEKMLESKGIGSQIVKTEGFGEEYAKHPASESNEQRSPDRDIALRFVK